MRRKKTLFFFAQILTPSLSKIWGPSLQSWIWSSQESARIDLRRLQKPDDGRGIWGALYDVREKPPLFDVHFREIFPK